MIALIISSILIESESETFNGITVAKGFTQIIHFVLFATAAIVHAIWVQCDQNEDIHQTESFIKLYQFVHWIVWFPILQFCIDQILLDKSSWL